MLIRFRQKTPDYLIKLVGTYIRQKWILMVDSIRTKLNNINWTYLTMIYVNVQHLVQLYDDIAGNEEKYNFR